MTPNQLLTVASSQIGYREGTGYNGRSNYTKYWAELKPEYQGGAWCAAFVVWCLKQCDNALLKDGPTHPYYTPSMEAWAKKEGRWITSKDAKPGDVVIFGNSRIATHTGIFQRQYSDSHIVSIEGNTSSGNRGSQTNGGGVYRRVRPRSFIRGVIRIQDQFTQAPPAGPPGTPRRLDEDGELGPKSIDALEWYVAKSQKSTVIRDGSLSRADVRALQTYLGLDRTGKLSKADVKALQEKVGAKVDGAWGPNTTLGIQRWLNRRISEVK